MNGTPQFRKTYVFGAASDFVLHSVAFAVLVWWSWRKWLDPIVDFGRELYVPWQITQGKVLYVDIASLFGPLSPYLNALWMRLFGVSLMTIAWCNVAIFALILAAVHRLIRVCTDRYTANCATLMVLVLCGFSQYLDIGNYNFATPYSHEATHGFALSVLTMLIVQHAVTTRRPLFGAAAGLTFGLSLMTKPELPVAVATAVCVGFMVLTIIDPSARRFVATTSAWLVGGALVAPILFLAYFRRYMDTTSALKAVAAGWITASNSAVTSNPFYLRGMGLNTPVRNALLIIAMFVAAAAFVALLYIFTKGGRRPTLSGVLMQTAGIGLLGVTPLAQALPLGRSLPLVAFAAVVITGAALRQERRGSERATQLLTLMMWAVFALVLLGKIGLNARIYHYGFYLALPAVTVAIVLICWAVPQFAPRWETRGIHREYRLLVPVMLAASTVPYIAISQTWYGAKTLEMGSGPGQFYVFNLANFEEGARARDALDELNRSLKPGDTVAVLPEGVMLNYLSRRESPLRVVTLMPPEILTFGEADVVRSLEAHPPTLIVFVHKDTGEYGYDLFGTSPRYGRTTMEWIRKRYRSVRTFGNNPTSPSGRGLEIFERM